MPRRAHVPGPGHYEVKNLIGGAGSRSISWRGSPPRPHPADMESLPGPGNYAPEGACLKAHARCLIGKASRWGNDSKDTPGPCEYTPRDPRIVSERRTMGERKATVPEVPSMTPGPGTYTPAKSRTAEGSTNFARSTGRTGRAKIGIVGIDSPGPAAYELDSKQSARRVPSAAFGTSPRIPENQWGVKTPGPGSYNSALKPKGPLMTMAPRRDDDY
eukprot:TRINITY_DN56280_c0_g1_i1.p1 TRINITY_DN56280_c0_g1~~TRINITY_DN56280_c0_g1_i1.p1  ORF type:complete len:216 (-),score=8.79 TRINITY_DN56280_c0_g1_i1:161-808(-)